MVRSVSSMDVDTIQTYDLLAREYDEETTDFWEKFPRTIIETFAGLVQGCVLDVGSGPGRDGLLLKERGIRVMCLDASAAMVALCRERGLEAVVGDFAALPFEDGSFGGVWAYTSLLHVPKAEVRAVLKEIRRVLADGGVFGLGLIEGETEGNLENMAPGRPRWFSFYAKEEIEALLKEHGFTVLFFETFKPRSKNYLHFIARKA